MKACAMPLGALTRADLQVAAPF